MITGEFSLRKIWMSSTVTFQSDENSGIGKTIGSEYGDLPVTGAGASAQIGLSAMQIPGACGALSEQPGSDDG
jgi:hypothetical protein